MTLVIAVTGPETVFLLADRRVTWEGRPPKEDACKLMTLEATDGVALLGYAGLGMTVGDKEPSEWMSGILRGQKETLEQYLDHLAQATKLQLPRNLAQLASRHGREHHVVIPAFVGGEARLYSIGIAAAPDGTSYEFYYRLHVRTTPQGVLRRPRRVALAGSGARYLSRDKEWIPKLLRVIRACDRQKVSPETVADCLADISNSVHLQDRFVGPRSIVVWRHRKDGIHKGGGGMLHFTGTARDSGGPPVPTIAQGRDVVALWRAMEPAMMAMLEGVEAGKRPELDKDAINAAFARLPDQPDPDDSLR